MHARASKSNSMDTPMNAEALAGLNPKGLLERWIAFNVFFSLLGSDSALIEEGLIEAVKHFIDRMPFLTSNRWRIRESNPEPAAWQAGALSTTPQQL